MCGRLNVIDDPLAKWVSDHFGISFTTESNFDLRPTQEIATISRISESVQQIDTTWGIKPSWSKKLIINAQSETAATKKTFKNAYARNRCMIPCTGWYEWRDEGGERKQRYSFTHADGLPFLMAGIWFQSEGKPQLVTLTTHPNEKCFEIHKRMPVLIMPEDTECWLSSEVESIQPLLLPVVNELIRIEKC